MRYLRKVPSFFEQFLDGKKFSDLIAKPLCATLFRSATPRSGSTSASASASTYTPLTMEACAASTLNSGLGALPHHSLWSSHETAIPSLDETQNLLAVGFEVLYGTTRAVSEVVDMIFPVLRSPVLSQDLHIFAVALATAATDFDAFNALSSVICIARLAQVLIEPVCTGHGRALSLTSSNALSNAAQGNSKRAKKNYSDSELAVNAATLEVDPELIALAEEMIVLRNFVCHEADAPVVANTLSPMAVLDAAVDAWIPFLEFAFHLKTIMLAICGHSQQSNQDSFQSLYEVQCKLRHGNLLSILNTAYSIM
jgi:hypothetical protein